MAYNLKNSLVWLVFYKYFSPTRTPILYMAADFIVIFPCAVIYVLAFLGKGVDGDKGKGANSNVTMH